MSTKSGFIPLTVISPSRMVKWVCIRHIVSYRQNAPYKDTLVEIHNNYYRSFEVISESPEDLNELIRLNS